MEELKLYHQKIEGTTLMQNFCNYIKICKQTVRSKKKS